MAVCFFLLTVRVWQDLVAETIKQITLFKPEVKLIKRRIASLIDREYIQRRDGEIGMYEYC